jgi:hypothetical protein
LATSKAKKPRDHLLGAVQGDYESASVKPPALVSVWGDIGNQVKNEGPGIESDLPTLAYAWPLTEQPKKARTSYGRQGSADGEQLFVVGGRTSPDANAVFDSLRPINDLRNNYLIKDPFSKLQFQYGQTSMRWRQKAQSRPQDYTSINLSAGKVQSYVLVNALTDRGVQRPRILISKITITLLTAVPAGNLEELLIGALALYVPASYAYPAETYSPTFVALYAAILYQTGVIKDLDAAEDKAYATEVKKHLRLGETLWRKVRKLRAFGTYTE